MIANKVQLVYEKHVKTEERGATTYIDNWYTVSHNGVIVVETKSFAEALQAYINRAIV